MSVKSQRSKVKLPSPEVTMPRWTNQWNTKEDPRLQPISADYKCFPAKRNNATDITKKVCSIVPVLLTDDRT